MWNEPDGGFWYPTPDATAYADLYLQTREAIQSVAAGSRVIVGGLTRPVSFVPAMLAARPSLGEHLDGLAIHLYLPTPAAVVGSVRVVRALLNARGLSSVPLYITEVGWSTRPAHNSAWAPPRRRPGYIARTVTALGRSDCRIAAVLVYSWMTNERDAQSAQDWYGIHPPRPGRRNSADTEAFASAVRAARANKPPERVCGTASQ